MNKINYLKRDFPSDAFEGTEKYYLEYRIPYPQVLIDNLIMNTHPQKNSVLLDLACGPGRLTFPLSNYYTKVIAADRDAGMINAGKKYALNKSINKINWINADAEDLVIEPNSIDLITIGDAFDRLDQELILNKANYWLKPGGYLAIIGMYAIWRGNENWHQLISEIILKWSPIPPWIKTSDFTDISLMLKDKQFTLIDVKTFEFENKQTIDSIIGYLFSTSRCSKKLLGKKAHNFEEELRSKLKKLNENGEFVEKVNCGFTIGKKAPI